MGSALTAGSTGEGLRAWKQNGGGKTYFLYDGGAPVVEMNSSGNVSAVNTFGANGLLSRTVRQNPDGSAVALYPTWYTFDPSGNVAQRLGFLGASSSDLYDAFGARQSTSSTPDVFGFGGQWGYQTDAETGLVLCTHRYYDPSNGRWLTRDPIGYGGGVNLYGYTHNNPVNLVDPSGLDANDGSVINNSGGLQYGLGNIDPSRYRVRPTSPGEFPPTHAKPPYVAVPIPGRGSGPNYPVWPVGEGGINNIDQNYIFPVAPGTTVGGGGVDIDAGWDPCKRKWIKTGGAPGVGRHRIPNPGEWTPGSPFPPLRKYYPPGDFRWGPGPDTGSNFGNGIWPDPTRIVTPPIRRR